MGDHGVTPAVSQICDAQTNRMGILPFILLDCGFNLLCVFLFRKDYTGQVYSKALQHLKWKSKRKIWDTMMLRNVDCQCWLTAGVLHVIESKLERHIHARQCKGLKKQQKWQYKMVMIRKKVSLQELIKNSNKFQNTLYLWKYYKMCLNTRMCFRPQDSADATW